MRTASFARHCMLAAIVVLIVAPTRATGQAMPGGLEAGPHAVGFRIVSFTDSSRPIGPRLSADQRATDRARRIRVHVWYPAAASASPALTISNYLEFSNPASAAAGAFATTHRQDVARLLALTLTDADWSKYTSTAMRGRRDVAPSSGRFPLLVGMLRPISVVAGAEYLASQGYVVAYVERQAGETFAAEGLVLEGLVINEHQRDMQLAIARLRDEPYVDAGGLGLVGFATDGLAQLPLAMRHPDVDAVALLESNWLATGASSYQHVAAFDPPALRVPLFFAYSENLGRNTLQQIGDIELMRYAPRHILYFGEPRMTPLDLATEGVVLASLSEGRRAARDGVTRAFVTTHRYQLRFLDAFVKDDAGARGSLDKAETAPAPRRSGALIELTVMPAVTPALTRTVFRALLDADLVKALDRARQDLARDPKAQVFDAGWLDAQGYDAVLRGQTDRAIAIYTLATEAAPRSAQAFNALSETFERAGRRAEALSAAEKALNNLAGDASVPAADRPAIADGLRARIARLKI